MKISINKTQRTELTDFRAQLAAFLADLDTTAAESARLNDRQQKLEAEIATLEKATDDESEIAAAKLATKRVQLEQVIKKLEALANVPAAVSGAQADAILDLLRRFTKSAYAAAAPVLEAYQSEAAQSLRPWCQDDANAKHLALTLPAVTWLFRAYSTRFGDFGVNVTVIKSAIARADELLAGELSWSFDPKMDAVSK